jgi:hypothetical protein
MAFNTPSYEYEKIRQIIAKQYQASEHDEVYCLIEPFLDGGSRVAECILRLPMVARKAWCITLSVLGRIIEM